MIYGLHEVTCILPRSQRKFEKKSAAISFAVFEINGVLRQGLLQDVCCSQSGVLL
jgi:hypothetical protein